VFELEEYSLLGVQMDLHSYPRCRRRIILVEQTRVLVVSLLGVVHAQAVARHALYIRGSSCLMWNSKMYNRSAPAEQCGNQPGGPLGRTTTRKPDNEPGARRAHSRSRESPVKSSSALVAAFQEAGPRCSSSTTNSAANSIPQQFYD
jgi:hypothetical protein